MPRVGTWNEGPLWVPWDCQLPPAPLPNTLVGTLVPPGPFKPDAEAARGAETGPVQLQGLRKDTGPRQQPQAERLAPEPTRVGWQRPHGAWGQACPVPPLGRAVSPTSGLRVDKCE